jgi:hypothetical protein
VAFEVRRAGPEVRRLSRLAGLLEQEPGYEAVAAVYYDTLVHRYGDVVASATGATLEAPEKETLQKIEEARARRDALLEKPEVQAAFPRISE